MTRDDEAFLRTLTTALSGPDPCRTALARAVERVAAESGTVHLLAESGLLRLHAHLGIPPLVLELIQRIPVGKGMAGLAVERRGPVTACNLQTDTSGDVRPGALQTGLRGSIVVPILRGEEPVGALGVANRDERTFTDEEVRLLTEIGRRLAQHVDPPAAVDGSVTDGAGGG